MTEAALKIKQKYVKSQKQVSSAEKKKQQKKIDKLEAEAKDHQMTLYDAHRGNVSQKKGMKAQIKLMELSQQIETIRSKYLIDFGEKREFGPLYGKCFDITRDEKQFKGGTANEDGMPDVFTFTFCPFANVTQYNIKDGGDNPTVLGRFDKWKGSRKVQFYQHGDKCWGGPDRTVHVTFSCALDEEITDVRENGKCEYYLWFSTPAACNEKHLKILKLNNNM
eukprot:GFYU01026342.1.p1 GENE.GFYU01026342.1~~GFYU01026342.1.p1  ORF type:complete len:222 (+),score=55.91 GFYU01026342.1:198-863(+)